MLLVEDGKRSRTLSMVSRAFIVSIAVVALIIAGVTVYSLVFRASKNSQASRQANSSGQLPETGQAQIFTGIGRMRISTSDAQPAMLILFVSFVYNPGDKAFSEELILRIGQFRDIITGYLGSFSTAELKQQNEENLKRELLSRFNAILRLGQIETMYFSDFIIVG